MAFIPAVDVWEVVVQQSIIGHKDALNVYHVAFDTHVDLNQARADDIRDVFDNSYGTSGMLAVLAAGWDMIGYKVTDLTTDTAPSFFSASLGLSGTAGGEFLPGQTSGLITWYSALRGRNFTGRTYHAGFVEGDSDGNPSGSTVLALNDFAADLIANMATFTGAGSGLAVLSRFDGTEPNPNPAGNRRNVPKPRDAGETSLIANGVASTHWKTQRRRSFV